jgi:PhzF family phenazine biosynthesis protein
MTTYAFRIINVFAEAVLEGNPLAVFEDARCLDTTTMQALALQFNLSETTFVLPSSRATAAVRIFTPSFEMPFAGHPTLGTAYVVRDLCGSGDDVTLDMRAGIVPVHAEGDRWTLTANAPRQRAPAATRDDFAAMLGLARDDVRDGASWIDTGSEQLVIPLASFDAVRRARPSATALARHANNGERTLAYVFAREGDDVLARFFFDKHGAVVEDPGTGSACANLGGWLLANDASLPQRVRIAQGEAVGRRCRLDLTVDSDRSIRVGGRVVELGRGNLSL